MHKLAREFNIWCTWSHRQASSLQRWWVSYIHSFGLNIDVLSVTFPTAPHTEAIKKGKIVYTQVVHEDMQTWGICQRSGDGVARPISINTQKVQDNVLKLWTIVKSLPEISQDQKDDIKALNKDVIYSLHKGPKSHTHGQPCNCLCNFFVVRILGPLLS